MCCCGTPTINGEAGYRWQPNDTPSVRPVNPPALAEGDTLLYDEPGRCGGIDSHSHHYRVVKGGSFLYLLVRHGGGDERIRMGCSHPHLAAQLVSLDSNARYWLCNLFHGLHRDGENTGRENEHVRWYMAAAQKRIRTRKDRGRDGVKVWIVA